MFKLKPILQSRNGSGTYSLPANSCSPAVTSTTISSSDFNEVMDDIEAALTQSVSKDGQTVMTGDLDLDGNAIIFDSDGDMSLQSTSDDQLFIVGGALNEAKGSDIASATTTDIGAATGNYVDVTGTTTITGLGTVQAGTRRTVQFDGALTLTYNATSLILPGNANITTAAGDIAEFVSLGSGNWIMVNYLREDAFPLEMTYGSFSPTIQDSSYSDSEGQVYSQQYGYYQRIGDMVLIQGGVQISDLGTLTAGDPVVIANLPITSGGTLISGVITITGSSLAIAAQDSLVGTVSTGTTRIDASVYDVTTGTSSLLVSELSVDGALYFSGCYRTA